MKNSHRLFRVIGDIPDEYVDDASNGKPVIRHKSHHWKTIVSAAAVFAAVSAIPLWLSLGQNKGNNQEDSGQPVVTEVSENAVTTEAVTEISVSESNQQTDKTINDEINTTVLGTGPKKPDNYIPDRKYTWANVTFGNIKDNLRIHLGFINDKAFSEEIAEFIEVKADTAINQLIDEMNYYERKNFDDSPKSMDEKTGYSCQIINVINGYMTVEIKAYAGERRKSVLSLFDIIENRIIVNYSDMFWQGENLLDLFSSITTFNDEKRIKFGFSGGTDFFRDYDYYTREINDKRFDDARDQLILDSMISGVYRDISSYVNCSVLEKEWDEWYYGNYDAELSGHKVHCKFEISRFYSYDEIIEHNRDTVELFNASVIRAEELGFLEAGEDFPYTMSIDSPYSPLIRNICIVNGADIMFDRETHSIIEADDMLKDWRNYIVYAENTDNSKLDIPDPDNYIAGTVAHAHRYVVTGTDGKSEIRESFGDSPYIVISEDEVDNYDMAAFNIHLYEKDTKEKINVTVLLPLENVDSRYFDKDNYPNDIRHWYV